MHRIVVSFSLVSAISLVAPLAASAVTIDWTVVGNPGNAADTVTPNPGYGAVGYSYRISTYDVTNNQYVEFLNAKDPTGVNTLGIYNSFMTSNAFGGINFNAGASNGSKYSVQSGEGQHPVIGVGWYDSIRFANWLNNGQGSGDTESGAYTLLHAGSPTPTPTPSNGLSITRNAGATVFLPSEDEWYKAAYYNPATSSYFLFPTSSDDIPNATGPTAMPNSANYNNVVGNLTDVGAYSGTMSPYGAFDMGGNVFQWNESLLVGPARGLRGGSVIGDLVSLISWHRSGADPTIENANIGFRVASIPEPSTLALAALGALSLLAINRRRHN